MRRDVCVFSGFALSLLFATTYRTAKHSADESQVATVSDRIPLGVSRQQLLDAIAGNQLEPMAGQSTGRYVVELNRSGATIAVDGPATTPHSVILTTPLNNGTAPIAATVARQLAKAILGDDARYGEWVGKAIHKCEPGFDIVGQCSAPVSQPGVIGITMGRAVVNEVEVLTIRFRRTK